MTHWTRPARTSWRNSVGWVQCVMGEPLLNGDASQCKKQQATGPLRNCAQPPPGKLNSHRSPRSLPMNIRFLESFVLLARIGSVRRVAELVHASPGAVSMRIRGLESDLGVTLFHWDRKTLQITDAGARLLRHAEAVIEATRTLERAARSDDAIGCRLRVGVLETAVHTFLPEFVKAMGASLPHIELDLTVDLSTHLSEQMMRRDLDLIVRTGSGVDPQFAVVENLLEVPVHWIARRGLVPRKDGLHKALGKQLLTQMRDRKSTRLNSSHSQISYAVFCLKKKKSKIR